MYATKLKKCHIHPLYVILIHHISLLTLAIKTKDIRDYVISIRHVSLLTLAIKTKDIRDALESLVCLIVVTRRATDLSGLPLFHSFIVFCGVCVTVPPPPFKKAAALHGPSSVDHLRTSARLCARQPNISAPSFPIKSWGTFPTGCPWMERSSSEYRNPRFPLSYRALF